MYAGFKATVIYIHDIGVSFWIFTVFTTAAFPYFLAIEHRKILLPIEGINVLRLKKYSSGLRQIAKCEDYLHAKGLWSSAVASTLRKTLK